MAKPVKLYSFEGKKVQIILEFKRNKLLWVVICNPDNEYENYDIVSKNHLVEWEKSDTYLKEKEREEKLQAFKARKDNLVKEVQKKALKSLESRIRFNVAFGTDTRGSTAGLQIAEELKKIVESYKEDDVLKEASNG